MTTTEVRKAASGHAWHTRYDATTGRSTRVVPDAKRVHLTDGEPYSRTGHNVRALCGASVWPDEVPVDHPGRVCAECQRRADGPMFA